MPPRSGADGKKKESNRQVFRVLCAPRRDIRENLITAQGKYFVAHSRWGIPGNLLFRMVTIVCTTCCSVLLLLKVTGGSAFTSKDLTRALHVCMVRHCIRITYVVRYSCVVLV